MKASTVHHFMDGPRATGEVPVDTSDQPTVLGTPSPHVPRPAGEDEIVEVGHLEPVLVRRTYQLTTERAFHVVDITDGCRDLVASSGVREGLLSVYSPHTTCAIKINERETCFLEDLRLFMETLVPKDAYYRHDDHDLRDPETLAGDPEDEPINGHAHIKQMLLGTASETVPIVRGKLLLGRWQRVMFIELDQSRPRCIELQIQGWR
ncbi:MAG TPA: secondary thiamine-phosphate synthase enzyme YjbQ [Egibacteraceae bacterium]